jgi:phytoene/squalene synthetase
MKEIYDNVSLRCSKLVTRSYSTSFSLGIRLLHRDLRAPIYSIYGFVRFADEIVDTFHQFDKKSLLNRFREDTYRAIEEGISLNPILNSFQEVVNQYGIERDVIDAFLHSMEMDLDKSEYDRAQYEKYILGSAEVVGLMCLSVYTEGDKEQYKELKHSAMKLGSAFQKVNFLRDLKADYESLGRTYFPNVDMNCFDEQCKAEIEKEIEEDFNEAYKGIVMLPNKAKLGVYLAYVYYTALFQKIKKSQPQVILNQRVRIPNQVKYGLILSSYFKYRLNPNL